MIASIRRNAVGVALLLMAVAVGLSVYTVVKIQNERTASIVRECEGQNERNRNTIRELDHLISSKAERQLPTLLINQLAPRQNCQQVLSAATSTKTKPSP